MAKNHAYAPQDDRTTPDRATFYGDGNLTAFAANIHVGSVFVAIGTSLDSAAATYIKASDAIEFADKLRAVAFEAIDKLTAKVKADIEEAQA